MNHRNAALATLVVLVLPLLWHELLEALPTRIEVMLIGAISLALGILIGEHLGRLR